MPKTLGAKLRKLRLRADKSLQEVADKIGVSKSHISNIEYELSYTKLPASIKVIRKLAKVFDVPIDYFVEDEEDDEIEFKIMFRDLQEDFRSLSDDDRETIELMIQSLKNRRPK